ncbi:MAG: DUF1552 domain-containing protein [Myxococcota bacterium]|jgi:hypothetical protein|nr:DUF1552 domain-containing protein [Myxococcota bacterium]
MKPLNRRTFLRGLVGGATVAIGLPPLEMFLNTHGTAYAASGASGFPRRFGMFYWGNGHLANRWVPAQTGVGDEWSISDQLMPLAAFKPKMTLVTGLDVPYAGVGEPHFDTACRFMAGEPLVMAGEDWTFSRRTFDQVFADHLGADTRFKSLEFGSDDKRRGLSYRGPYAHAPAETSPYALFERVFGGSFFLPGEGAGGPDEGAGPSPHLALERSVLDAVIADIDALTMRVGAADKIRLEQHFDGIRAIENQLAKLEHPPQLEACGYPTTPEAAYGVEGGLTAFHEVNAIFSQIAAHALACDQTRVVSNWFTAAVANSTLFPGQEDSHHSLTHFEADPQPHVHQCVLFCIEALAQFLEALDSIEEGDGTLLDHMIVLGTSDCASGKLHSGVDFPIVLVGGGDGALVTDIHWRSDTGDNATQVPLTVARALGIDMADFGVGEHAATLSISEITS